MPIIMPLNRDSKTEKWTFQEFVQYCERTIADGVIREGFGSIRTSMYSIVNVYDQCKKEGFRE